MAVVYTSRTTCQQTGSAYRMSQIRRPNDLLQLIGKKDYEIPVDEEDRVEMRESVHL